MRARNCSPTRLLPCVHCAYTQWGVVAGRSWELLEGVDQGQTQVDSAPDGDMVVWAHPLDIHYSSKGLTGWPKLHFQVWSQDVHGRNDICECCTRMIMNFVGGACTAFEPMHCMATMARLPFILLCAGGYGFCHVPTAPGMYEIDCPTWIPEVRCFCHQICI